MNCDYGIIAPIRWACRHVEYYDSAARSVNNLLLSDVSPAWVTFLGIACIIGMIIVILFAFRHQP